MGKYTHSELEEPMHETLRLYGFEPTLRRRVEGTAVSAEWQKNGYTLTYQIDAKWAEKPMHLVLHMISDLEIEVHLKPNEEDEKMVFTKAIKSSRTALEVMRMVSSEFGSELASIL